eukprot:5087039-Amphidinium_carterae.1
MAAKQHYNVAGTPIVQLASNCGLTKREYCEQVWDSGATNSPPALFVWVLACVYRLSMAVIDSNGTRLDGTPCRSTWTLVNHYGAWEARGVDDGSRDVELSPTLPFITSDSEDGADEDTGRLRQGGANGRKMEASTRKRQREEVAFEGQPLRWPEWNSARMDDADENEISVRLPNGEVVEVRVHMQDKDGVEDLLAGHLAVDRSWLSFHWRHNSIEIAWSSTAPCWKASTVNALREVVQGFQARQSTAFRRRALEKVKTYSFGLRATRKAGISKITREHADFVCLVNHLAQAIMPYATYNAFAIVVHASVRRHVDSMNHPDSLIHMLSWTQGQVWVQTDTGVKKRARGESAEEDAVCGNEHALNRGVVTIPARSAHEITVEGPLKAKTLVLYTTRRPPTSVQQKDLLDLGFPPLAHQKAKRRSRVQPQEESARVVPEVQVLEHDGDGYFTVDVQRVDVLGQPAVRAPVLHVTMAAGAVIRDLREALRRRLKHNPNKLVLLQWHTVVALCEDAAVWPVRDQIALAVRYNQDAASANQPLEQQADQQHQDRNVEARPEEAEMHHPVQTHPALERAMEIARQAQEASEALGSCVRQLSQELHELKNSRQDWYVSGAGRQTRVLKEKLVDAAANSMIEALPLTKQGLLVEHLLVRHIMAADHKATRAVFQATTVAQRYRAFSSALKRAGLTAMAAGIANAATELDPGMKDVPNERGVEAPCERASSTSQPLQQCSEDGHMAALRTMVRQVQQDVQQVQHQWVEEKEAREELQRRLAALDTLRVAALEKWAHEVDDTSADPTKAAAGECIEVHQRLCALEEQLKRKQDVQAVDDGNRTYDAHGDEIVATQDPYQCG